MRAFFYNKKRWIALALIAVLGACIWWQRGPIMAWYCIGRLAGADEADRETWLGWVVSLDEHAVPGLLAELNSSSEVACNNASEGLQGLARQWGCEDRRAVRLIGEIKARFATFSLTGKTASLRVPVTLLREIPEGMKATSALVRDASDLIQAASATPELVVPVLVLAGALVEKAAQGQCHDACRELALAALRHEDARTRVAGIHLSVRGPLRQDLDLLARITPLLGDREADVRQAAVLALGSVPEALGDDELLPLLHDSDERVQQVAEVTLRSRGLDDGHLNMARLISDPRPQGRLQVLQHLRHASDLDPGVWLQRLCQDSSPAVRAAAIRAAVQQQEAGLRDRIVEMAGRDPSPTVRDLAAYYLQLVHKKNDR